MFLKRLFSNSCLLKISNLLENETISIVDSKCCQIDNKKFTLDWSVLYTTKGTNSPILCRKEKGQSWIVWYEDIHEAKDMTMQNRESTEGYSRWIVEKDTASSVKLVSTIRALANPKKGDGTRCLEG